MRLLLTVAVFIATLMPSGVRAAERIDSADPRLDAMYQMALRERDANRVTAIRDWAYNGNKPIPCECFETGEKWNFVWTRDLSFAADLALAATDPQRVRNSLAFKLSEIRSGPHRGGLIVAQDTGSGGSWPISTDRVVWFLAARHVLGQDPGFDARYRTALEQTLQLDRETAFDERMGLYRGETSFLDWREQTYPQWTRDDVTFLGESFALSTNVLHYQALRQLAALKTGAERQDWQRRAARLKQRIVQVFWEPGSRVLHSVVGPAYNPMRLASMDLLGISLAIDAGILTEKQALWALNRYPVAALGSPVVWPQQPNVPIYHNRAMWPFVSAYALRAARQTQDVERIRFEINSILDGAAQNGSNMENYELVTRAKHVDDGALSGPVVNSPRQLWSVGAMLMTLREGIFGLRLDGRIEPKLPIDLAQRVFGQRRSITMTDGERVLELRRPKNTASGNLWVKASQRRQGNRTIVQLRSIAAPSMRLHRNGAAMAPATPQGAAQQWLDNAQYRVYLNGRRVTAPVRSSTQLQCWSATRVERGIESLPSQPQCGPTHVFTQGAKLPAGSYRLVQRYENSNGPINTGITANVRTLLWQCAGQPTQAVSMTLPHSVREQDSTAAIVTVKEAAICHIEWAAGTNMSDLELNRAYTGGKGGEYPLNDATLGPLLISPVPSATIVHTP